MIRYAILFALVGCTDEPPLFGPPTESVCPPGSAMTYQSFGERFMTDYCTECHHSDLKGAARKGAPTFHDFNLPQGIRAIRDHIDWTSAAGPAAINESMPPSGPRPTEADRLMLGEWLACGAP